MGKYYVSKDLLSDLKVSIKEFKERYADYGDNDQEEMDYDLIHEIDICKAPGHERDELYVHDSKDRGDYEKFTAKAHDGIFDGYNENALKELGNFLKSKCEAIAI